MQNENQARKFSAKISETGHIIRHQAPPLIWQDGFPAGNGFLGAMIWGDGSPLCFTLDCADLWDSRTDDSFWKNPGYTYANLCRLIAAKRYDEAAGIFGIGYDKTNTLTPTKISIGRIECAIGKPLEYTGALDIDRAVAEGQLLTETDPVRWTAFVHRTRNLLCLRVACAPAAPEWIFHPLAEVCPDMAKLNHPPAQRRQDGHRENGEHWWTWVFRTADFTVFRIADTRGSTVLDENLGPDFSGFLGADFFSAYRTYMEKSDAVVQFCLAHLIRDVRFLCESTDAATAHYGEKVLDRLRRLFHVLHRKDALTPEGFQRRLEEDAAGLPATAKRAPERNDARNLANRFREYGEAYARFVTHPEIAPTNNEAEQARRFCVIDRCITQGTRSEKGRAWCERIWTAAATCRQRGASLFRYLEDALGAHFHSLPAPSLLA